MPIGSYQVADVLMLVLCIAPVATYFLTLGLVNSHSRPWMISGRSDFISLTVVLIPLLIWPLPMLAQAKQWWLLSAALVALTAVFLRMLPSVRAGFVIYNITESRCLKLVHDAITKLGWQGAWNGSSWTSSDGRVSLSVRGFTPLRNVTLNIESNGEATNRDVESLRVEMERRFESIAQMPSTMGACLVMLGLGLMIIPIWMVSRHIDDLVDAVTHLF